MIYEMKGKFFTLNSKNRFFLVREYVIDSKPPEQWFFTIANL
jgi:hypothetical protein